MSPSIILLIFLVYVYVWVTEIISDIALRRKKQGVFIFDSANLGSLRVQYLEEFFFCLLASYYPKINITVRQKPGFFTFVWLCPLGRKEM